MKRELLPLMSLLSLLSLYIATFVSASTGSSSTILSSGTITSIGCSLYDENMNPLTLIDWGLMQPTDTKTVHGYLKNTGNSEALVNHYISASNPLDLFTWASFAFNLTGHTVPSNLIVPCEYTLSTTNAPEGTAFAFNITVAVT